MQWRYYELRCKTATVAAREHKHREKLIFLIYPMLCMATGLSLQFMLGLKNPLARTFNHEVKHCWTSEPQIENS